MRSVAAAETLPGRPSYPASAEHRFVAIAMQLSVNSSATAVALTVAFVHPRIWSRSRKMHEPNSCSLIGMRRRISACSAPRLLRVSLSLSPLCYLSLYVKVERDQDAKTPYPASRTLGISCRYLQKMVANASYLEAVV
ncbi:hypothetical protein BR93DRAFT_925125 [Coniochaeta sp. PMI_546]|nr:hypothetical protein BR93DRAFT_925125 [Coniochaeta sp. PMI_546]